MTGSKNNTDNLVSRDGYIVNIETGECVGTYFQDDIDNLSYKRRVNEEEFTKSKIKTLPAQFNRQDKRLKKLDMYLGNNASKTEQYQRVYFLDFVKALDIPEGMISLIFKLVFNPNYPKNLYETIPRIYEAIVQTKAPVLNKDFIDMVCKMYPKRKWKILERITLVNRDYAWVCREMLDNIEWLDDMTKQAIETKVCENFAKLSRHFDNKLKLIGVLTRLSILRVLPDNTRMPPFSVFHMASRTYYLYIQELQKLGVVIYE